MGCVVSSHKIRKRNDLPSHVEDSSASHYASGSDSGASDSQIESTIEAIVLTPSSFLGAQTTHDERPGSVTPRHRNNSCAIAASAQKFSSPQIESAVREFDEALRRFGCSNSCPADAITSSADSTVGLSEPFSLTLEPTLRSRRHEDIILPRSCEPNLSWMDETEVNLSRISRLVPHLLEGTKTSSVVGSSNVNTTADLSSGQSLPKTSKWLTTTSSTTIETCESAQCSTTPRSRRSSRVSRSSRRRSTSSEGLLKSLQSTMSTFASSVASRFPLHQSSEEPAAAAWSHSWPSTIPPLFTFCGQPEVNSENPILDSVVCRT